MKQEILSKLNDFIDAFETEYGDIEGFKVMLERNDNIGIVKSFKVIKLVEEEMKINN